MKVPAGWTHRAVGELAEPRRQRALAGGALERPYVGLEHLGPGTLRRLGDGEVDGPTQLAEPDDVLFGTLRPNFRKLLLVREPLRVTPEALVLRPRVGTDPRFLLYLLADPARVDACVAAAHGTRMPRVPASFVLEQTAWVPPFAEQQAIGRALGDLDDRAALHLRGAEILTDLARATAPDGPPRPLRTSVRSVNEPVQPGDVPADLPYLGLEHLARRQGVIGGWGQAGQVSSSKLMFRRGDVLFGRLRPNLHKVALAPFDGVCSADILVLRALPPHGPLWAWTLLSADATIHAATSYANGTRMPRVGWEILGALPVPTPDAAAAARYTEVCEPWLSAILRVAPAVRDLDALRDALLPSLIRGERHVGAGRRAPQG